VSDLFVRVEAKTEFCRKILIGILNINLKNPFTVSRMTPCGRMDRQKTEGQTDLTKLIVAFRNFVLTLNKKENLTWKILQKQLECLRTSLIAFLQACRRQLESYFRWHHHVVYFLSIKCYSTPQAHLYRSNMYLYFIQLYYIFRPSTSAFIRAYMMMAAVDSRNM
jgi:hypothetical protein